MDALVLHYAGRQRKDAEDPIAAEVPDLEVIERSYAAGPPALTRIVYALPKGEDAETVRARLAGTLPADVRTEAAVAPTYRDAVAVTDGVAPVRDLAP